MPIEYLHITYGGDLGTSTEYPCSAARRSRIAHDGFAAVGFFQALQSHFTELRQEYDRVVATRVIGFFRGEATRYKAKCEHLEKIISAFYEVRNAASSEMQNKLCDFVKLLKEGAEKFTTFERMSRFAKLLEKAYFSLTDVNGVVKQLQLGLTDDHIPLGQVVPYPPTAGLPPAGYLPSVDQASAETPVVMDTLQAAGGPSL